MTRLISGLTRRGSHAVIPAMDGMRRGFLAGLATAPFVATPMALAAEAPSEASAEPLSTARFGAADSALQQATAAAAERKGWVSIDGPVDVTADLTVATPVQIRGGPIRVADGATLTFSDAVVAPPRRAFAREDGWRGKITFAQGTVVTPSWWEDGTDDDTEAVQAALRYDRVLFTRRYRVRSVEASGVYQTIDMADFGLYGIATEATDAVLSLRNWRDGRLYRASIASDGGADAPKFALNYACALRATSDKSSTDKTQYGFIYGLRVGGLRTGVVWGSHAGEPPQSRETQSEFHIYDYRPRGVLRPFVGNALNAFLQFHAPIFQAQRFESSAALWADDDGWTLRNEAGVVHVIGGSLQRAIKTGYNLYGGRIVIEGADVERNCPDYLTGSVAYHSCRNGYFGASGSTPFVVAPGAKGRLLLNDTVIRRQVKPPTADFDAGNLVDAMQAPDYEIVFRDAVVGQWRIDTKTGSAYLVRGGRVVFGDLTVNNDGAKHRSYSFREGPNRIVAADPTGRSMPEADDLSAKGGWTSIGRDRGGGFHRTTADLPAAADHAIRLHGGDGGAEIETATPFAVESGRDRVVDFWLKDQGKGGRLQLQMRWLDAVGGEIGREVIVNQDHGRLTANGFGQWLRFRAVALAPTGATGAKLSLAVEGGGDMLFTDLRVV